MLVLNCTVKINAKINIKAKGSGLECPLHTAGFHFGINSATVN